jgi:SAM-dependent methyltransferase
MLAPDVRADFDTIARLSGSEYAGGEACAWVADLVPASANRVLDVGCGAGGLVRALARPGRYVTGIDFSPEMIRLAQEHSRAVDDVEFVVADLMAWSPPQQFDAVATVTTLHHLPLDSAVERLASWVRPGGKLVIVDLTRIAGVTDFVCALAALPFVRSRRLLRQLNGRVSHDLRRAWDEHAVHDRYLSMKEARAAFARRLPGCRVARRQPWRYVVEWTKPGIPA